MVTISLLRDCSHVYHCFVLVSVYTIPFGNFLVPLALLALAMHTVGHELRWTFLPPTPKQRTMEFVCFSLSGLFVVLLGLKVARLQ